MQFLFLRRNYTLVQGSCVFHISIRDFKSRIIHQNKGGRKKKKKNSKLYYKILSNTQVCNLFTAISLFLLVLNTRIVITKRKFILQIIGLNFPYLMHIVYNSWHFRT